MNNICAVLNLRWMSFCVIFACKPLKNSIVMKTEEKKELSEVAQVVFRRSSERPGYYLCHYGHITSDGAFEEESGLSFWDFLESFEFPNSFVSIFLAGFDDSEKEIFRFGYLAQERFDEFMRHFAPSSKMFQLYPGMLVLTFREKEKRNDF